MGMKLINTSLVVTSAFLLCACAKTEKLATDTTTTTQTTEHDVMIDVTADFDGERMIIMVNGEEQEIELSEMLGNVDIQNIDGSPVCVFMVNGEQMDVLPEDMMEHVISMIANGEDTDVDMSFGWSTDQIPEGMQMHMMQMMGDHNGPPARDHKIMKMMGDHDGPPMGIQGHMMQVMRGNPHGMEPGQQGEWRHERDQDIPEEHQFMEELSMLGEVSDYLEDSNAVAMMGIHMIRDELEGDLRMEALEAIIEETSSSAVRNAAIIVAIQTMQEEGDTEAAADLMVELVLSN